MRETVIILKIQFMLKYRIAHPGYSAVWLILVGLFFTDKYRTEPCICFEGKNMYPDFYSFILANLIVTIIKIFPTFLMYLILCLQMPFNKVIGFLSTAE